MADSLVPGAVVMRLRGRFGRDYRFLARCASTQRLLPPDAPEGAVATADEQTEGRGRLARGWLVPAGSSVLCSIALRPTVPPPRLAELSLVAGQACAEAIAAVTGLTAELKFPNDVLIARRKVAGILAEAGDGRVVLGIGINVHQTRDQLPNGVETPATSLDVETGTRVDRIEVFVALLERLERHYDDWIALPQRDAPIDD